MLLARLGPSLRGMLTSVSPGISASPRMNVALVSDVCKLSCSVWDRARMVPESHHRAGVLN